MIQFKLLGREARKKFKVSLGVQPVNSVLIPVHEWSGMVWACVEEGWWVCFEISVGVWSEEQEETRTTKEDMENASGEGEQECWFREGWCLELSKMEIGS